MTRELNFKYFLINEQQNILAQKIGDVLSALQTLNDDLSNLGSKDKNTYSDRISSDIKSLLRKNWPKEEIKYLGKLQAVAVAIKKTIEERGSLEDLLPNVIEELQNILEDMGAPINTLVPTDSSAPPPEQLSKPAEKTPTIEQEPTTADATAPQVPQDVETLDQGQPPNSSPTLDPNFGAAPLGGSSGPMLGI